MIRFAAGISHFGCGKSFWNFELEDMEQRCGLIFPFNVLWIFLHYKWHRSDRDFCLFSVIQFDANEKLAIFFRWRNNNKTVLEQEKNKINITKQKLN